jgi:hypothetical protein
VGIAGVTFVILRVTDSLRGAKNVHEGVLVR